MLKAFHRCTLFAPPSSSLIEQTLGVDYDERVLPSIGNEVLKAIVVCIILLIFHCDSNTQAQFDAGELITQRDQVSAACKEALNARAKDFNIILDDISITHLTFGTEFTRAVEYKQVAQQEAERARFLVEQAEQEKLANIIRAEGDSQVLVFFFGITQYFRPVF